LLTCPATVRPDEGDHYLVAKAMSCNQRGAQVGCKPEDGDPDYNAGKKMVEMVDGQVVSSDLARTQN